MKHNHDHGRSHHDKGHSTEPGLVSVNFEYTDPRARTVSVAGTFNDWHPTTKSMYSGKRPLAEGGVFGARHL